MDPRRHLAAAIGWAVFAVVGLSSLAAANLAAAQAERRAQADTQRLLTQFAVQVRHGLGMNVDTRLAIIRATAAQITASEDRGNRALRRHLEAVQAQFPEFTWLGVADAQGQVVAATRGMLEGQSVAQRPWFAAARAKPFLGPVHQAQLLEPLLPAAPDGQPLRFVDAAAPLVNAQGAMVGVVGGHLAWSWIEQLQRDLLRALDTRRQIDLILATGDGLVLSGPPAWIGKPLGGADLSEGGRYLVARHDDLAEAGAGLPWVVVVRQPSGAALVQAKATQRTVFLSVLGAGVLAALAAVWLSRALLRRLADLAAAAQAVRRGERSDLGVPVGVDEVGRIAGVLSALVDQLQREKQALATLNAELDQRVAERSARIERLAEEGRVAAVTRERLRLARDLHDTLAHSLMALLTQIRLVRKLRPRWAEAELEAELARAEDVAASGLAGARAAITQMRHNGVQESGLGPALGELLKRFSLRSGVTAELQADPAAAAMSDERAETLFRIVEEALNNVERHAHAGRVTVELRESGETVAPRRSLSITDDGAGFDTTVPVPGHYGLLGMREQAALVGATLSVRSAPGQGTRIELEFAA
jgi:signal transduction histidine kinase